MGSRRAAFSPAISHHGVGDDRWKSSVWMTLSIENVGAEGKAGADDVDVAGVEGFEVLEVEAEFVVAGLEGRVVPDFQVFGEHLPAGEGVAGEFGGAEIDAFEAEEVLGHRPGPG
jgi:hypothetical protein